MFYYRFVRIMQFFKLNMNDNWEPSVGEVKLWEYRYVFSYVPFTLVIRLINCWDFIQIWYYDKMLSSQWDNDNQHFVYIIVSWYLLAIITHQGFLFSCSCMNRCTCSYSAWWTSCFVQETIKYSVFPRHLNSFVAFRKLVCHAGVLNYRSLISYFWTIS